MKPIAVIYGTEEYLMEQARRRFVADCQQRAGGDAAVRQFKKDARRQRRRMDRVPLPADKARRPVAQQAVQGRDVVFGKAADPVR